MPIDNTIALQAKAPEFNPLAQMLQVRQYQNQTLQGNQLQQAMTANQAAGEAIQNRTGPDGKVDISGVQADLSKDPRAAYNLQQTTGENLAQQGQQTKNDTAGVQNQGAVLSLRQEQLTHLTQQLATLTNKSDLSRDDVVSAATQAGRIYGLPDTVINQSVQSIPQNTSDLRDWLKSKVQSMDSVAGQSAAITPKPMAISTGGNTQIVDGNTNSNPGLIGSSLQNTVSPDSRQAVTQDRKGNFVVVHKTDDGSVSSVSGANVPGQKTVQPQVIPENETPETIAALQAGRGAVNTAAQTVNAQHFNNRSLINILDSVKPGELNPTGAGAATLAKWSSSIGVPISGSFADNYGQINHYLALQTQANEKGMGVSSDAGRVTASAATGSTGMTPSTLRKATSVNDATASGLGAFNQGQEAAIAKGGIPAARQFQNAWSQYYDVNALRLLNADQNGDKKEAADVVSELGGTNSAAFKKMYANAAAMQSLKSGIIPKAGK